MTQKQEYARRGLLAKIHQHPGQKQRKEMEVWEEFLFGCYKVRSSADLSINELFNLLDVLNNKAQPIISGIRPRRQKKIKSEKTGREIVYPNSPLTEKQEAKIRAMWKLVPDNRGLVFIEGEFRHFCIRQTGEPVMYLHNLTTEQAHKIITGSEYLFGLKTHKTKKEG